MPPQTATIPFDAGDFRLMSRNIADVLLTKPERDRFLRGMVRWAGFKQTPPCKRAPRFAGATKYPLARMACFAVDGIFSFSIKPLPLSVSLGIWPLRAHVDRGVFWETVSKHVAVAPRTPFLCRTVSLLPVRLKICDAQKRLHVTQRHDAAVEFDRDRFAGYG